MLKFPIIIVLGSLLAQGLAFVTHPAFSVVSANQIEPGIFLLSSSTECAPHTL